MEPLDSLVTAPDLLLTVIWAEAVNDRTTQAHTSAVLHKPLRLQIYTSPWSTFPAATCATVCAIP